MYEYSFREWQLFLYMYCFLGWCFETLYVSIKEKHFANRGFLKGPVLPIYGFAAIAILLAALPFRTHPVLVWFLSALAATLLELVTGIVMEAVFKVRYWDYRDLKFNLHGYISLFSSLTWGFLGIILVYVLHKPMEYVIIDLPDNIVSYLAFVITVLFAADFATSIRTALDIKKLLGKMEELKKEYAATQKRLTEAIAETGNLLVSRVTEKTDKERRKLEDRLVAMKARMEQLQPSEFTARMLKRNPQAYSFHYNDILQEFKEKLGLSLAERIGKFINNKKKNKKN